MISTVIVTYNEQNKIKTCLENIVDWSDEVVIVDLGSTDKTQATVKKFGCRLVKHPYVSHVELVRNFAISQCKGNWILVLDPDEQVPDTLKKYLLEYTQHNTQGVLNIPRMNIFFGARISHTNFWPDYQIRFFNKGSVTWQEKIHSYPLSTLLPLKLPLNNELSIKHIGYENFADFIQRQNRYSSIRAQEKFKSGDHFSIWSLIYLPLREFVSRYLLHFGFLDKTNGLFLSIMLMSYHVAVEFKLLELERSGKRKRS